MPTMVSEGSEGSGMKCSERDVISSKKTMPFQSPLTCLERKITVCGSSWLLESFFDFLLGLWL